MPERLQNEVVMQAYTRNLLILHKFRIGMDCCEVCLAELDVVQCEADRQATVQNTEEWQNTTGAAAAVCGRYITENPVAVMAGIFTSCHLM